MSFNKINILASSILIYLVTYDFLFFNLEDIFNIKLFIFKVYFEVITLLMFVVYFVYLTKFFQFQKLLFFLTVSISTAIVYAVLLSNDIFAIAKDFRLFFLPILLNLLFYSTRIFETINIRKLIFSFTTISILLMLFGFYEYIIFDGTVDSIWRYEFLLQAKKDLNPDFMDYKVLYQVLRDGSIRVSSMFISALDYSFYVATFGILIFIMTLKLRNMYLIPLFIVILFSLYISQVRTGFILLFSGIFIYFLLNSKIRMIRRLSFCMPFVLIGTTFLVLLSGSSLNDASSLGRLLQYYQLMNEFTVQGNGMGQYAFDFDSLYIYIFLTYGLFGFLFFYFNYWIVNKLIKINNRIDDFNFDRYEIILLQFMIVFHLTAIYLFAFQHTLGSPTFFILYFFSFIILSKANYKLKQD